MVMEVVRSSRVVHLDTSVDTAETGSKH